MANKILCLKKDINGVYFMLYKIILDLVKKVVRLKDYGRFNSITWLHYKKKMSALEILCKEVLWN